MRWHPRDPICAVGLAEPHALQVTDRLEPAPLAQAGVDGLLEEGLPLANMETGQHLKEVRERVVSANAYLGVGPVIKALDTDSQVIITGRVTDTGIACAPPVFEFGWPLNDWDRLAAGVVAGHILECGAQATGGNLTDWREVHSFHHMAFPIVEFEADGSFVVGKHPETGGMVNVKTVTAQLWCTKWGTLVST